MPLRVNKIGAILAVRIGYTILAIYRCGTAEWQPVGWQFINASSYGKLHMIWLSNYQVTTQKDCDELDQPI